MFLGESLLSSSNGNSVISSISYFTGKIFNSVSSNWKPLNIVTPYLGKISSFEVGFLPGINSNFLSSFKKSSLSYLIGVDNYNKVTENSFVVYQGPIKTNSVLFNKANIILPISTYTERDSTYINLEGRLRFTKKVITPFKFVFSDSDVVRALSFLRKKSILTNYSYLPNFYKVVSFFKELLDYSQSLFTSAEGLNRKLNYILGVSLVNGKKLTSELDSSYLNFLILNYNFFSNTIIPRSINNYYSSDYLVKNSKVMSMCAVKAFSGNFSNNLLKK